MYASEAEFQATFSWKNPTESKVGSMLILHSFVRSPAPFDLVVHLIGINFRNLK